MFQFKQIKDENGRVTHLTTHLRGHALLSNFKLNKGCAFSREERETFGLLGILPSEIETLEQQSKRMYAQFHEHHTNLSKNIYLNMLHDYNETLFYKLVSEHLEEMLPIIYTPTVGDAVQRFSLELRKPKGLQISFRDRDKIDEILENRLPPEIDLAVVTDGGAVLGIGDQGIGGINISSAKLMVYTLAGGVSPHRVLPIQLDVGTNNLQLLNDPMYLGWRHERLDGQEYDDFIEQFVRAITKKFPNLYLHWEDVSRNHARNILNKYRNQICTVNGDVQTTGVVALACVLSGVKASSKPLNEHTVVIFGAGTAGTGIADQIYDAMRRDHLTEKEARAKFFLVDRDGLLMENHCFMPSQEPYSKNKNDVSHWTLKDSNKISLLDVVKNAKPTILIGCSTVAGAFNEEIVREMAKNTERPIILPLSNPTSLTEAVPEDLFNWTNGKVIVATGSPFPDVKQDGKYHRIAQSNNALAFPGIGLGVIAVKATRLTDGMLWAATKALSESSPANQDKTAPLLPKLSEARMVSMNVAVAVAEEARREGVTEVKADVDLKALIKAMMWEPVYYPFKKD